MGRDLPAVVPLVRQQEVAAPRRQLPELRLQQFPPDLRERQFRLRDQTQPPLQRPRFELASRKNVGEPFDGDRKLLRLGCGSEVLGVGLGEVGEGGLAHGVRFIGFFEDFEENPQKHSGWALGENAIFDDELLAGYSRFLPFGEKVEPFCGFFLLQI